MTTRNTANAIIDGPSQSTAYTIKQIGSNVIADNSITPTKPAESFMKQVHILDSPAGHAIGWNPDGVITMFIINPAPGVSGDENNFVDIMTGSSPGTGPSNCNIPWGAMGFESMAVRCDRPPEEGADLFYQSVHLPTQTVS